jgi:quercetin dioxygenase-like cupin family protein
MDHWNLRTVDVQTRRPAILATSDEGRALMIALSAGESLDEHEVHERAWLLVIDGDVEVESLGGDRRSAGPGELFTFAPSEPHAVRATSDARLLLLLTPWPGDGHPGAQTLDAKASAPRRAAEHAARSAQA